MTALPAFTVVDVEAFPSTIPPFPLYVSVYVEATIVIPLLELAESVPLLLTAVTVQVIEFPISAVTVVYVEDVAPDILDPALFH